MSDKLPRVTGRQMLRALERAGWSVVKIVGSHHNLRGPGGIGRTTVPIHGNEQLPTGLVVKILRDTGLEREDLVRLL